MGEGMLITLIASVLIVAGLVGTALPVLPGTAVAFTGIVLHKLMLGDASVSWSFVAAALVLTILALVIDIWANWWGARCFGASWKGALGAVLGGLGGMLLFSFPGLILGPIVGAILFELLDERSGAEAALAGFGTVVGSVVALGLKLCMTMAMAVGFYIAIL